MGPLSISSHLCGVIPTFPLAVTKTEVKTGGKRFQHWVDLFTMACVLSSKCFNYIYSAKIAKILVCLFVQEDLDQAVEWLFRDKKVCGLILDHCSEIAKVSLGNMLQSKIWF